jgi:hypothetical protein
LGDRPTKGPSSAGMTCRQPTQRPLLPICGRGLVRSLDSLLKLRRAPELVACRTSVVDGPLSAAGDTLESSATTNETNEPTDSCEIVTNEPTDACEIVTSEPNDAGELVTNEPNGVCENLTNEATDTAVGLESPTYMRATEQDATNEPTDACENVTNEATLAADVGLESPTYTNATEQNTTNEPTDDRENVTDEPTFSTPSGGSLVGERYLAPGQEPRFTAGGRGSARAGTGWDDARTERSSNEASMVVCIECADTRRPHERSRTKRSLAQMRARRLPTRRKRLVPNGLSL